MSGISSKKWYGVLLVFILLVSSCVEDKLDFERFSERTELNPSLAAPIVKGKLTFENIYGDSEDSTLTFDGDTIIYFYKEDSLVTFDVSDFGDIPTQDTLTYYLESEVDIPEFLMPDSFYLSKPEDFTFSFENGMRPDSILLNSALIHVGIQSTYKHTGVLRISSPSLIHANGEEFSEVMAISSYSGNYFKEEEFSLNDGSIRILHPHPDTSKILINFDLFLRKTPGEGISADEFVKIDFSIAELNDYKSIFGYAGQMEEGIDTIVDLDLGDIKNLDGTFAVTNPKLNFNFTNSMGVPFALDLNLTGIFKEKESVDIAPDKININYPTNYLEPEVKGKVSFNRQNIHNIDSILVFPPPVSLDMDVSAMTNPDGETENSNFINSDSKLNVNLEIEVPLEFRADLQFRDTMDLNINNFEYVKEIEYIILYYNIRNEFPLGLDFEFVLYDSINQQLLDTIKLGYMDQPLLSPAPVDEMGVTIKEQVKPYSGFTALSDTQADHLLNHANKIIVNGTIKTTSGARTVKILNNYLLDFKLGLEAKAKIQVN